MLQENGIELVLISGGGISSTSSRAEQLGIKYCYFNVKIKENVLEIKKLLKFNSDNVAYIGDDLNDLQ